MEENFTNIESVTTTAYYTKYPLGNSIVVSLKFNKFSQTIILHCDKRSVGNEQGLNLNFGILIEPFSFEIWVAILFSVAFYTVIKPRLERKATTSLNELLRLLSKVFGHEAAQIAKYFPVVCAIGYLNVLYGNGLTSLITAPNLVSSIKRVRSFYTTVTN